MFGSLNSCLFLFNILREICGSVAAQRSWCVVCIGTECVWLPDGVESGIEWILLWGFFLCFFFADGHWNQKNELEDTKLSFKLKGSAKFIGQIIHLGSPFSCIWSIVNINVDLAQLWISADSWQILHWTVFHIVFFSAWPFKSFNITNKRLPSFLFKDSRTQHVDHRGQGSTHRPFNRWPPVEPQLPENIPNIPDSVSTFL